jgi:hypothetical protein
MLRLPVRTPGTVGLKVTPAVQLAPADPVGVRTVVPLRLQGFVPRLVRPKSPVGAGIVLIVKLTELLFVIVSTPIVELVVPTCVLGNAMLEVAVNEAFTPVPLRFTFCGLPGAPV